MRRSLLFLLSLFLCSAVLAGQSKVEPRRKRAETVFREAQRVLIQNRNADKASSLFSKAAEIDPTYPAPLFNLGVIAQAKEDWDGAIKWYTKFLSLDSKTKWAD